MKQIATEINWKAYFEEFCREHGSDPVDFKGRLLFKDGWTYSKSDHAGPEWSPQGNGLGFSPEELLTAYWTIRRDALLSERAVAAARLTYWMKLQEAKSIPLQQKVTWFDPDTCKFETKVGPIDFDLLRSKLNILSDEIEECRKRLLIADDLVPLDAT